MWASALSHGHFDLKAGEIDACIPSLLGRKMKKVDQR